MLKKILLLFFAVITICTCSVFAATAPKNRAIIIYYSINSDTRMLADKIHEFTGSDMFEVQTAKPYPDNYKKFTEKILHEVTYKKCPKLKQKKLKDLYQYDTVFIGIPVYYGEIAPAMRTFLKANSLKGKTVLPFFSLDNGGLGKAWKTTKRLSGKTHFKDGFEYRTKDKAILDSDIIDWIYDNVK